MEFLCESVKICITNNIPLLSVEVYSGLLGSSKLNRFLEAGEASCCEGVVLAWRF